MFVEILDRKRQDLLELLGEKVPENSSIKRFQNRRIFCFPAKKTLEFAVIVGFST